MVPWSSRFHCHFERLISLAVCIHVASVASKLTLQHADVAPFYLYEEPKFPYLCPIFAYTTWVGVLVMNAMSLRGPVFRKPYAGGKFGEQALVCTRSPPPSQLHDCLCILQKAGQFLDLFRHNLMDIDVDPRPYGTHSFRRGGAQFLHRVRRWSIIKVCDWGGWSKDNDAQSTIFKYLLSWNDSPHHTRREMLHPSPPLEDRCHTCNRNCNCH